MKLVSLTQSENDLKGRVISQLPLLMGEEIQGQKAKLGHPLWNQEELGALYVPHSGSHCVQFCTMNSISRKWPFDVQLSLDSWPKIVTKIFNFHWKINHPAKGVPGMSAVHLEEKIISPRLCSWSFFNSALLTVLNNFCYPQLDL